MFKTFLLFCTYSFQKWQINDDDDDDDDDDVKQKVMVNQITSQ